VSDLASTLRNSVERLPNRDAICVKRDGAWLKWDFTRYYEDVRVVAKAFLALGLEDKDCVAIMSSNSPEWFMCSLGAIFAGGLSVRYVEQIELERTNYCFVFLVHINKFAFGFT
jgi:long-subunit acyl-CoA synthetase (AMP-forming)